MTPITAPILAVAMLLAFRGSTLASNLSLDATNDPNRTSHNVHLSGKLNPTEAHPYLGFWKISCNENFGLAITVAGPGMYSVSFCGPGGCFKPGTYRPDTRLVGDDYYKIESLTRIAVKGMDGKFAPYVRCWPAP